MAFTVGMKVVCVCAMPHPLWGESYLVRNDIYTIRALVEQGPFDTQPGVLLEEIHVPNQMEKDGWSFSGERFRPVVERKQEVSFTTGADPQSDKWDNRRPVEVHTFDEAAHQEIFRFLAGF